MELSEIRYMKPWLPIHTRELQWDINIYFSSYEMEEMALTLSHSQFVLSTVWRVSEFSTDLTKKRNKKALDSVTKHPLPLSYNLTNL